MKYVSSLIAVAIAFTLAAAPAVAHAQSATDSLTSASSAPGGVGGSGAGGSGQTGSGQSGSIDGASLGTLSSDPAIGALGSVNQMSAASSGGPFDSLQSALLGILAAGSLIPGTLGLGSLTAGSLTGSMAVSGMNAG